MDWASADLYDDHNNDATTCSAQFRSFGAVPRFCGAIETIRCFEDNTVLRKTLESDGENRVLVVDGKGSVRFALFGDMLAALAVRNNWAGIIINGAVRDTQALKTIQLGILALGVNPAKCRNEDGGRSNVQLIFGDAVFTPQNWVYCDSDGVLIAPRQLV